MAKMWRTKQFSLSAGVEQDTADHVVGEHPALTFGVNLDFSKKGSIRGRPGAVRTLGTGVSRRGLDASGRPQDATVADFAAAGYASPVMCTVRDHQGERPAMMTRGRLFTWDGDRWTDRLGFLGARWDRIVETRHTLNPTFVAPTTYCAMGYDFGPGSAPSASAANENFTAALLDTTGALESHAVAGNGIVGTGNSARCGTRTGMVFVQTGTNNLVLVTRNAGAHALTSTVLAANALGGGLGGNPVICCDFDETAWFIAYYNSAAAGQVEILRVNPATAAITHSTNYLHGVGPARGLWITNTAATTNRLVVGSADGAVNGVFTRVYSSSALVNQAIDVTLDAGNTMTDRGQVVVGAAQSGNCWVSWVTDAGTLKIATRSLTAATSVTRFQRVGGVPTGGGTEWPTTSALSYFIQHQPVLVGGRVLLGLWFGQATGAGATPAGTWGVYDVTDVWPSGVSTATSCNRDPVLVARGDLQVTATPWNPQAGVLATAQSATSYRFPTLDYKDFFVPIGTAAAINPLYGRDASLGLNEVVVEAPAVAHYKGSTVFAGSVPRLLARGHAHPVGFPSGEYPAISASRAGGGALPAGSYSIVACWAWVDDSGQVHRSAPSVVCTLATVVLNDIVTVLVSQPHFNERETGRVYSEVYMTSANPSALTPKRLQSRVVYDELQVAATHTIIVYDALGEPLYTDGGVLEINSPSADGGVVAIGDRCFISDGHKVFASRLGPAGTPVEGPSWHLDTDTLELPLPATAGRVIALSSVDGKLVIMCARGIWVSVGPGPDDVGVGQRFSTPERISDIGISGARAYTSTPRGLFFEAANTLADGSGHTGGLMLLDRSLTCTVVSLPIAADIGGTGAGEVVHLPERERLFWTRPGPSMLVLDMRVNAWCQWTMASGAGEGTAPTSVAAVAGLLWGVHTEPFKFSAAAGSDTFANAEDYAMELTCGRFYVGDGPGGWGRCRYVKVLDDAPPGDDLAIYALQISVEQDGTRSQVANWDLGGVITAPNWYGPRHNPTLLLEVQKCGVLEVNLQALPAVAAWTGLEFHVKPSIARQRSMATGTEGV